MADDGDRRAFINGSGKIEVLEKDEETGISSLVTHDLKVGLDGTVKAVPIKHDPLPDQIDGETQYKSVRDRWREQGFPVDGD